MQAINVPDHIDILASLAGGAQMHMTIRFTPHRKLPRPLSTLLLPWPYCSDVLVGAGRPTSVFWIYGTKADLHYTLTDGGQLTLTTHGAAAEEVAPATGEAGGWRVEEEFIAAIRGAEKISHTRFEDGVQYMEFTTAVRRSWQQGVAVSLPLVD